MAFTVIMSRWISICTDLESPVSDDARNGARGADITLLFHSINPATSHSSRRSDRFPWQPSIRSLVLPSYVSQFGM